MATVARPQVVGGGSSGLKAALIVFVVLTVASLTGTIILYTYQADLQADATRDAEAAQRASDDAREARTALSGFANDVTGAPSEDSKAIQQQLTTLKTTILQTPGMTDAGVSGASFLTVVKTLNDKYSQAATQLSELQAERDSLNARLADLTKASEAAQQEFTARLDELQAKYQQVEQDLATAREGWNKQVTDLNRKLTSAGESASEQLRGERQARQSLEQQLAQRETQIQELLATLAAFKPSADQFAALQIADGTVVRTVPTEKIAYISLGSRDRIRPGMTFAVYARHKGVSADGKGKATLEVTHVFDTTSEAKVLSTTRGEPIMEGDVVANPVYDRSRQFNFVVSGNFDLDFDGQAEDRGGQEVIRMIESWGGRIVKEVDTRTDFVVLGSPPAVPTRAPDPADSTAVEHAREADAVRQAFERVKSEARSLSIPVLTRTQFLHFIGRPVPQTATDNSDAM
ncbi:MAG: hypothetical protein AMXMBFR13_14700 [Phycisphaerae bacterium]